MQMENVKELRVVRSMAETNNLLSTGAWQLLQLQSDSDRFEALLARTK